MAFFSYIALKGRKKSYAQKSAQKVTEWDILGRNNRFHDFNSIIQKFNYLSYVISQVISTKIILVAEEHW